MVLRSFFVSLLVFVSGLTWAQPCATITLTNPDTVNVCLGDELILTQNNSLGGGTVTFSSESGFIPTLVAASATVSPTASGFIRVNVSNMLGCSVSDSIYVDVDRLVAPPLIAPLTVCQGDEVQLLRNRAIDTGNSNYLLIGGDDDTIRVSTDPNFSVEVFMDTTFTLVSRSDNGVCEERQSVRIDVTPGTFEIQQDTVFSCLGVDSVVLSVNAPGVAPEDITWRPARFNSTPPSGPTFVVRPVADITYYAEAVVNGCNRIDSVAVRLDSLPSDLTMRLEPVKDPYCQGDTFYVLSPVYDAGDFPVITHEWTVSPGLQSPRDLYNAVFVAQDTAQLTRITTNGGCEQTDSVLVNVVKPPVVTFSPIDPVVCPGEPLQITATFEEGSGTLEWEDPTGSLSCTDCLNPVATVQVTTEYKITVDYGSEDCKSELSYTVTVEPAVSPSLTTDIQLCPGESRVLITGGIDPNSTYRITGGGEVITDPTLAVTPLSSTTYTIETTNEGCGTFTQTIDLVVLEYEADVDFPATICAGEPLILTGFTTPSGVPGTFTYTLPGGVSRTGQQVTVNDAVSGTYAFSFSDAQGCKTVSGSFDVEVLGQNINPLVVGRLEDGTSLITGGSFFSGNSVVLSVSNLPTDRNFTYSWAGNYTPATATGAEITVTVPRQDEGRPESLRYTVTVTSADGGCSFEAVIVLGIEQSQVQVPDFFTPDNDGRNDRFRLFFNGSITDYTMIVYDRWGQKVFTSDDPLQGWDGTKGGTPQNADTYLYLAKFRQDGVELQREGQFTLLR